jgi:hypothetical protein
MSLPFAPLSMLDEIKAEIDACFAESVMGVCRSYSEFGKVYELYRVYLPGEHWALASSAFTVKNLAQAFLYAIPTDEGRNPLERKHRRIVWRRLPGLDFRKACPEDEWGPAMQEGWYGSFRCHLMRTGDDT